MKKRILSLALALCMMLSVMPTSYAGNGILTLGDSDVQQENTAVDTPVENAGPSLTLDGIGDSENEPKEQPVKEEPVYGVLTPDGFETENREEEPNEPIYGVLTPDEPIEDETDNQSDWEDNEPAPGVLYFQCDFCGYLDGNHADHCPTLKTEDESEDDSEEEPEAVDISTIKATLMSAKTYQDIFDALMSAETLDEFESILDELAEDKLEEFYALLSDDDLDALDEQEDNLASEAVVSFEKKEVTKKTVTVERRASLFGAAQRELLRQMGYELIVNIFGRIVDMIDLPQNDYTVMEAVSPETSADYQWQILADDDLWVDIYNETDALIRVSYAMVANLLDRNDAVQVRCEITGEDGVSYTDPVEVTVDYTSEDVIIDAEAEPVVEDLIVEEDVVEDVVIEEPVVEEEPVIEEEPIVEEEPVVEEEPIVEEPVAQTFSATRLGGTYAQPFTVSLLTGTDGEPAAQAEEAVEKKTYNVVVNYVFENNEIVTQPYTANLAEGSSFSTTITFPVAQGYLPYWGEDVESSTSYTFDITNIQKDEIYTVTYKPTNVEYTVIHYWQNVGNDNYTEYERETLQGLTGSHVSIGDNLEVANTYDGFYALLYEKPAIAADGSTVVEIYYDRYYYLINFDMGDGGYGTEPIYARYGVDLGEVADPTRAGCSFLGWSLNGTDIVSLPKTMPAENRTYTAVWQMGESAKVSIVFWGENANDEGYSHIESTEIYATPGQTITYGTNQLICSKEVHTHIESCGFSCGYQAHTHSESCYDCGITTHNHSEGCYPDVGDAFSANLGEWFVYGQGTEGSIGKSYGLSSLYGGGKEYIYIDGTWYRYTGSAAVDSIVEPSCGFTEDVHVHDESCLECTLPEHTHTDACVGCGKNAHQHDDACYLKTTAMDPNLWTYVKSDTVTVAADGSTVMNVYYDRKQYTMTFKQTDRDGGAVLTTITDKWGADIKERFETISEKYSFLWSSTSDGSSPWTSFMDVMPAENRTYYMNSVSTERIHTATYLGLKIGGTAGNTADYEVLYTTSVKYSGNLTVSKEEFVEIEGFTFNDALSTDTGNTYNGAKFYYDRNSYTLTFNDGYNDVRTEPVKFEAPLSTYTVYKPTVPSAYEPGSVEFDGWYLNPECTGEEVDLTTHKMPAENLLLYAKWTPTSHTVEFYLNKDALDAGTKLTTHTDVKVPHGYKVDPVPATPSNGSYTFVGWFYLDENGNEKAFDFANMAVNKDMKVYGKWSSNVLKEYTIYYKIDGTDDEIAAPTTGSGLAGVTKTFEAKGGTDLYEKYQEGYFPVVKSHSLTLDINATEENDTNVYTFWYVQKPAVPYIVRYVDDAGNTLIEQKVVVDNRKAVVTETFETYPDYMPDAYQKRLILDGSDATEWITVTVAGKEVKVHPDNVITFVYVKDELHAYYKITHYTQNLDGATWTEYASSQAIGDIGTCYTGSPITISGFEHDDIKYFVDGEEVTTGVTDKGVALTNAGLEINLYYVRNEYPYQVRYLEQGTGKQLAEPKNGKDVYGEVISESAIDIANYTAVTPTSQTLNIRIEESQTEAKLNIITFYYVENDATINYKVVGPDGCGTVDPISETVKVLSGTAQGSTATAGDNYHFVGWYDNETCDGDPISTKAKYTPTKDEDETWKDDTTYYAKFEENEVTIYYEVVGSEGSGSVDPASESVKVLTGTAQGSTATAGENYHFVGWYDNETCDGDPISTNTTYAPTTAVGTAWIDGTIYYAKFEENEVTINYKGVAPDGSVFDESAACGTVAPATETVKVLTGTAQGSTAVANTNYTFAGWYSDASCTTPLGTDATYTPIKSGTGETAVYEAATYYAKFVENTVTINYVVTGPDGCGTVALRDSDETTLRATSVSETVGIVTGNPLGATANASSSTYKFVGWYNSMDELLSANADFVPSKSDDKNVAATYYAKFEYNVADLTITKQGADTIDENQTFIFNIKGVATDENTKNVDMTVVVTGNGSVTIKDMPVGQYIITEDENWSWRYTPADGEQGRKITVEGGRENEETFVNVRDNEKWLDSNAYCENVYVPAKTLTAARIKRKDEE